MPEEVLDGDHLGLSIEQLGGHGMPEVVTGDLEPGLSGIVLHSFLDTPNRYGFSFVRTLFHQEEFLCPGWLPHPKVSHKGVISIFAHIDDAVFPSLTVTDKDPVSSQVQVRNR